jgi:hypothetical protein
MCIAILNTTQPLALDVLNNSWENNNQGAGLLYNLNGVLTTFKTYDKQKFIDEYYSVRAMISTKIVLHFRIATSGHEKYTNLHPFLTNDNLGFVHNGIIQNLGNQQHSDTYQFNEMLKKYKYDFLNCKQTIKSIEKFIGGSKLLFLDSNDNHTIVNESLGLWDNGDWFSNDSYKYNLDFYYYGNEKVSKNGYEYTPVSARVSNSYLKNYLDYFSNVSRDNISYIEDLTGIKKNSQDFLDLIDEISYTIGSIDFIKITEAIENEVYDSYEPVHTDSMDFIFND